MTNESTKEKYIFSLILLPTSSSPFRGKLTSSFLCPFLFCLNPFCFSNISHEVSHRGSCLDYILMTCGAQEVGGEEASRTSSSISSWQVCWLWPFSQPWASAEALLSSDPNLFSKVKGLVFVSGKQFGYSRWLKLSRGKLKSHHEVMRPDYWVSHILAPNADVKGEPREDFNNGSNCWNKWQWPMVT